MDAHRIPRSLIMVLGDKGRGLSWRGCLPEGVLFKCSVPGNQSLLSWELQNNWTTGTNSRAVTVVPGVSERWIELNSGPHACKADVLASFLSSEDIFILWPLKLPYDTSHNDSSEETDMIESSIVTNGVCFIICYENHLSVAQDSGLWAYQISCGLPASMHLIYPTPHHYKNSIWNPSSLDWWPWQLLLISVSQVKAHFHEIVLQCALKALSCCLLYLPEFCSPCSNFRTIIFISHIWERENEV